MTARAGDEAGEIEPGEDRRSDGDGLYDGAPCGLLTTAPDGLIIRANRTFLSMTGYRWDDVVGTRRFTDLLTGGGRIYHETHYAPLLHVTGFARAIALDLVASDGSRVPVLVNAALERESGGRPLVVQVAVFDASERREYERQLQRAKERAEVSEHAALTLARTLQQVLIPPQVPTIPGLDVAAVYRPAGSGDVVGGDFYDVFEVGPSDWVVVLGDVCGKGADAAVVSALVRYAVRGAAVQHRSPTAMFTAVNRALIDHDTDRFCTALLLRFTSSDGVWTVTAAAAGHPLPFLRSRDGAVDSLGRPGHLLGVFDTAAFHDTRIDLAAGDTIVLYTDGVTEARRGAELFGDDRLRELVGDGGEDAVGLTDRILDDVLEFQDGDASDDIALVVIAAAPPPS